MSQMLSRLMSLNTKILLMVPSQSIRVFAICLKMGHDWWVAFFTRSLFQVNFRNSRLLQLWLYIYEPIHRWLSQTLDVYEILEKKDLRECVVD